MRARPRVAALARSSSQTALYAACSKNLATILAELAIETTGAACSKILRQFWPSWLSRRPVNALDFQAAQTVLSSPPAVPSNLSQRSGASRNEARYQAPTPQHNVDRFSRRTARQKRSYSSCKNRSGKPLSATSLLHRANLATTFAETDLRQAEAATSRHWTAW